MNPTDEKRIQRVISGLIPATAFECEFGAAQSLAERMAFYHTPGVSLAVIEDYQVAWARGFGVAEAGSPAPVTPQTLFQAASISKAIFALGVMRLVQEGRLDLDEDVNAYLTSWKVPAREGWQPRVTLRRLLSHSAGTTVHGFPGYQVDEPLPSLVQVLNGEPPANTGPVQVNILPGLGYRYSGGGTSITQQVVMDVLKAPFPEIMRALVLDPLGMSNSTYEQPLPAAHAAQAATAHPSKGVALRGKYHIYPEMGAAGLWTTPEDLAKAGVELIQVLSGKKEPALLTRETLQSMLKPQLAVHDAKDYVGLAMFCEDKGRDSGSSGFSRGFSFGHSGWNEGFVSLWRLYPEAGKGFVLMLNSNEGYELFDEIRRALAQEYGLEGVYPAKKEAVAIDRAGRYVGEYCSPKGDKFTVCAVEHGLALVWDNQPALRLYASSDKEFFAKSVGVTVAFSENGESQITGLTLTQDGKSFTGEKVGE